MAPEQYETSCATANRLRRLRRGARRVLVGIGLGALLLTAVLPGQAQSPTGEPAPVEMWHGLQHVTPIRAPGGELYPPEPATPATQANAPDREAGKTAPMPAGTLRRISQDERISLRPVSNDMGVRPVPAETKPGRYPWPEDAATALARSALAAQSQEQPTPSTNAVREPDRVAVQAREVRGGSQSTAAVPVVRIDAPPRETAVSPAWVQIALGQTVGSLAALIMALAFCGVPTWALLRRQSAAAPVIRVELVGSGLPLVTGPGPTAPHLPSANTDVRSPESTAGGKGADAGDVLAEFLAHGLAPAETFAQRQEQLEQEMRQKEQAMFEHVLEQNVRLNEELSVQSAA